MHTLLNSDKTSAVEAKQIFAIDDGPLVCALLKAQLKALGYKTRFAVNGMEAIA